MRLSSLVLCAISALTQANVYDLLMPTYSANQDTCLGKCATWTAVSTNATEQARIDAMWLNGKAPSRAENFCAMPAATAGQFECDGCKVDVTWNSFAGPWCYCDSPASGYNHTQYCQPSTSNPEQVNLQVASQDVVVASFVTHDEEVPGASFPPIAMFGESQASAVQVTGISHFYKHLSDKEDMNYILHFIKFANLKPSTTYTYKVKSGGKGAVWSDWFQFRSQSASPNPTRIGIYGDMGHSLHNCMGGLLNDCAAGKVDTIVHMGDHAYDLGNAGDRRGDAYMNAYQPTLSSCPWIPIIGNHEANDGDDFERYLNMTWGETLGDRLDNIESSADSALGDLLTKATLFGPGFHSRVPSNTSRYFSVDIGMIHLAGLDLNNLDAHQLAWLDADLSAVNRTATPWIIVSSHFPLHHASVAANLEASAAYYTGDEAERYTVSGHEFKPASCDKNGKCEQTIGEFMAAAGEGLEPLLQKHAVDIYDAGHVHDYNANWPLCYDPDTKTSALCKRDGKDQTDFDNPLGTVHICEGNGGVPGVQGTYSLDFKCSSASAPWCRVHADGSAYGRITAFNATHLQYEHVQNNDGKVTDSFMIVQSSHGPFTS